MKSKNLEKYGLKLSVFGTLFMAILGVSFGLWIQSEAILLDGFFNFISLIMAIASLWVSWLITQPTSNLFQFDYLNFIPFINLIKGLLISFVSLFALASSIITILEGGRTMNAGLAVIYAMIAAGGCLIIAIIQRKIAQKTNSSMVIVDAQNWLVNGLISFSVGIAFSIVVLIKGSPWEWFIPYSDSTIVIVMVLISLGVPIKIVIDNLKQLLLAAPNPKIEKELKNILTTVIQDLPCDQYTVRMTQTGQYLYLYIVWLLPQQDKNSTVKQIDEYRNIVTNALQQFNSDITVDIVFTEDQSWFKKRNKLKYLYSR